MSTTVTTAKNKKQPRPKDLRDEFAMVVLPVTFEHWYGSDITPRGMELAAEEAYAMADAMLKQREKK